MNLSNPVIKLLFFMAIEVNIVTFTCVIKKSVDFVNTLKTCKCHERPLIATSRSTVSVLALHVCVWVAAWRL